jgi:hypothetical protein
MMERSAKNISEGLRQIRFRRRLYLSIYFAFLPVCAALAVLGFRYPLVPVLGMLLLCAAMLLVYVKLNKSKCPRCHEYFFVQKLMKNNWTPVSSTSMPPQKKCQKCGLSLYS